MDQAVSEFEQAVDEPSAPDEPRPLPRGVSIAEDYTKTPPDGPWLAVSQGDYIRFKKTSDDGQTEEVTGTVLQRTGRRLRVELEDGGGSIWSEIRNLIKVTPASEDKHVILQYSAFASESKIQEKRREILDNISEAVSKHEQYSKEVLDPPPPLLAHFSLPWLVQDDKDPLTLLVLCVVLQGCVPFIDAVRGLESYQYTGQGYRPAPGTVVEVLSETSMRWKARYMLRRNASYEGLRVPKT